MTRLSVCMIVKNEAQRLPRALESVRVVADEIVVADTGSTDATIAVAQQMGARVVRFMWCDDFAAARNFCHEQAQGDWILSLDADEELLASCHDALRSCLAQADALALAVLLEDVFDERRPDAFSETWRVRLLRNRPDLRYVGRIHEHLTAALGEIGRREGLVVRTSGVRLRHHGYSAMAGVEKYRRARQLLELELAERPGQFYYLVELGVTQLALGEAQGWTSLAEAARQVIAGEPRALAARGQLAILLEQVLAHPNLPADFPITRAGAEELALKHLPTSAPLLWHLAAEYDRRGDTAGCAALLERLVELGRNGTYDRTVSFAPGIIGEDALYNLAACYAKLGDSEKAGGIFRQLLSSPTRGEQAAKNLDQLRRGADSQ